MGASPHPVPSRPLRPRTPSRYVRLTLAVLPWIGMLICTPFANRVEPFILGLPFLLFWVVLWVVLTAACMTLVYFIDPLNKQSAGGSE